MIPYETDRPLLTPVDQDGARRTARLRRLGPGERADASSDSFDAFADRLDTIRLPAQECAVRIERREASHP